MTPAYRVSMMRDTSLLAWRIRFATIVACFTGHAILVSPAVGGHASRAATIAFAQRFARFRRNGSQLRHMISNLRISADGDTAHAAFCLIVFLPRNGTGRMLTPSQYDCRLRKTLREWRFHRRVVLHDDAYALDGP